MVGTAVLRIEAKPIGSPPVIGRYTTFQMAEVAVPRQMFEEILMLIAQLRAPHFRDGLAWIAELTRDAVRGYERVDLTLKLRYAREAVERVQEMVRKERACCAFLTFEMREQADEVWLTIEAPEDARTMADALFEPF